jgi:hypothetical protein
MRTRCVTRRAYTGDKHASSNPWRRPLTGYRGTDRQDTWLLQPDYTMPPGCPALRFLASTCHEYLDCLGSRLSLACELLIVHGTLTWITATHTIDVMWTTGGVRGRGKGQSGLQWNLRRTHETLTALRAEWFCIELLARSRRMRPVFIASCPHILTNLNGVDNPNAVWLSRPIAAASYTKLSTVAFFRRPDVASQVGRRWSV